MRDLVVVRAGNDSRHPGWGTSDDWDLVISSYGNTPYNNVVDHSLGGKLESLHKLIQDQPKLFKGREYVWVPDDDLDTTPEDISRLFRNMRQRRLSLAQPSLSLSSYINHLITAHREGLILRYTNFVESMMPCFSTDLLMELAPFFQGMRFGWGIDYIWARYVRTADAVAIIDECQATHGRRHQLGELYQEGDPEVELEETKTKFGVKNLPQPTVYKAITATGSVLTGKSLNRRMAGDLKAIAKMRAEKLRA